MKRVYAPQEERQGRAAQQERDPPQQEIGLDRQSPEPSSGVLLSQLPSAPEARSLRQTAVRHLQQTHGNAHVQRELLSEVNRVGEDEEAQVPVEAQAPAPAAQAPTAETENPAPEAQAPTTEVQTPTAEAQAPTAEAGGPAPEAGQAPATISGDGSTVRADAGGVTIDGARLSVNAGMVNINSAMVTTSGVLRTSTLLADSVVASTYSPGVGNVY
jgi:hypothetical protein